MTTKYVKEFERVASAAMGNIPLKNCLMLVIGRLVARSIADELAPFVEKIEKSEYVRLCIVRPKKKGLQ